VTACGSNRGVRWLRSKPAGRAVFPLWLALTVMLSGVVSRGADAASGGVAALDEAALLQLVHDGQAAAEARRDAVAKLVDRASAATVNALIEELKTTADAHLRRTLLQGVRASRNVPPAAGRLAMSLAKELDAALLEDAGEIVGRTVEAGEVKKLVALAADRRANGNERLVATAALGFQRTQAAAKTLMTLLEPGQLPAIRSAAYLALARLTGIEDHGPDRERWTTWWARAQAMSAGDWQDHLLTNFTRRGDLLARQRNALQDRLITALRQRYRAVARGERELVLISMLSDPLDAVRELSLELVREIVNMEQVGPAMTDALVARLGDEAPSIRADATLILRDLKHGPAADIIAQRLAAGIERDRSVLRAYLLMMRRQPRFEAVAPSITLLEDPIVRAEAAGAVLASIDDENVKVEEAQIRRVGQTLRAQLRDETNPEPRFVELLGRVADEDDWARVAAWMDHEVDSVKEAAARTWVAAGRPLAPLAERAADPIIQAIVIPAATLRGNTTATLLALIEYKPKVEQMAAAWGRALIAMAVRVDPEAVLKADARLAEQNESTDLRLQVLSAGIDKLLVDVPGLTDTAGPDAERRVFTLQLADLLLARAEVRLASGDAKAALADLDRVTALKIDLSAAQLHRQDLIAICARINGNELDEAFTKVARYVNGVPDTDVAAMMRDKVIDLLINCADKCITSKQTDRAGQILSRLRGHLAQPVARELETRISKIEGRIKSASETPVGG